MAKQNAVTSLRESIYLLEIRQAEEGIILKEQFKNTFESLKPINLIKNSIQDLATSVEVKNSLFETVISIFTGYLTKKIMVNTKSNPFMKIVGVFLQYGVTSLISKNAENIRILFGNLTDRVFPSREEEIPETEV